MEAVAEKKFWSMPTVECAAVLGSDLEKGLSEEEAKRRLETYGRNTIESAGGASAFGIFLRQLLSPLILVLILAAVVTFLIGHYRDTAFILIAVIVNSVLGFWQENKAERALAELRTYLKPRARVIRGTVEKEVDAEELVPGDIIRFAQGDRVPADARVTYANDLLLDEAVLTGESLPVAKSAEPVPDSRALGDQSSIAFAGTLVTQGVGSALICRTDSDTELGKIAALLATSGNEKTPLQRAVARFSVELSLLLAVLTALVFIIGTASGEGALPMFLTSIAIAVSAIPEGLPVAMTVILAVGVERMAKRRGVVRKLIAAEALGSTTLILTDKTGTLTRAEMTLSQILPRSESEEKFLALALLNANVLIENPGDAPGSWRMNGRIMEVALTRAAALRGMPLSEITDKKNVLQTMPFNAVQKFSATLLRRGSLHTLVFLGAPDILLLASNLPPGKKEEALEEIESLASSGERVLGLATKEVPHAENFSFSRDLELSGLLFSGLISFRDPVRPGIKTAIREVADAGIKTVILTGDHRGTAVSVAREIGLPASPESVLDASELAVLPEGALRERLPRLSVISRVTPVDKLRIAKMFQERGEIVAMTGDGVNDAPALKQADVGVAMGSGTEVAQSVADLVLLDDNFETIVAAIDEGRQILRNIKKVLVYLLSNVADGLILIGGAIVFGVPLPLNALQILWVNFFSDSFPAVAFAFERDGGGLSGKPHRKLLLFDPLMKFLILIIGLLTSILLFVLYYILLRAGYEETLVRTFIFAAFGSYTLLLAFSIRSLEKSIFAYPPFGNRYLNLGVLLGLILMAAAVYLPPLQSLFGTVALPLGWALGVCGVGIANIALIEIAKRFFK